MNKCLLSIVTSTYNRCNLLKDNLERMLKYPIYDVQFIVGDNASQDSTWEFLQSIDDCRVFVFHNDINLGIENSLLLTKHINSDYFLFLNDRDWIEEDDLRNLISNLKTYNGYDIIANYGGGLFKKNGTCSTTEFCKHYFFANHPGHLIYNTNFFKRALDINYLSQLIDAHNIVEINNYIEIQLLLNISETALITKDYIQQPKNRDIAVKQMRKEIFGSAYVMPDFHINYLLSKAEYAKRTRLNQNAKMKDILLACYTVSLYKLQVEYHRSVKSEAFRKRNHIEDAVPSRWFSNSVEFAKSVVGNEMIKDYHLKRTMRWIFIKSTASNVLRVLRDDLKNT